MVALLGNTSDGNGHGKNIEAIIGENVTPGRGGGKCRRPGLIVSGSRYTPSLCPRLNI